MSNFNKFIESLDKETLLKITSSYEEDYKNFAKCLCTMHKEKILKTKEYKHFVLSQNKKEIKKENKKKKIK